LPPLSHNVVDAADSSQIQKEFLNYGPSGAIAPGAQNWEGAQKGTPPIFYFGPRGISPGRTKFVQPGNTLPLTSLSPIITSQTLLQQLPLLAPNYER
jgi:hypothetical protein